MLAEEWQVLLLMESQLLPVPPQLQLVELPPRLLGCFPPLFELVQQVGLTAPRLLLLVVVVLDHLQLPLAHCSAPAHALLQPHHRHVPQPEHIHILFVDPLLLASLDPESVHAVEQDLLLILVD